MKNIVIFGTGAAGRAIYRAIATNNNIVAFIDNNRQKQGSKYMDIPIYSVDEILGLEFDFVYIGGIWADEMEAQLLNLGLKSDKIMVLDEKDISFSTPIRERLTDEVMRILDGYFRDINMDYFICNSGLISILRGRALSVVSDVDLYVMRYGDLEFLAKNLPNLLGGEYQVNLRYIQDYIRLKSGDIKRINITNSDGVVIDIGYFDDYGKFKICDYDDGRFFYFPRAIFDGGFDRLNYKDFSLSVLKNYHQYLCFMYGENYIEIPKRFSSNDYLNLKTKAELDNLNI